MDPNKICSLEGYKITCSCRNCENTAIRCLRMAFINMEGDFCEACAKDLVDNGLVVYSNAAAIELDAKQRKVAEPTVKEEVKAKEQPFVAL